jgi:hypothetical protein
MDSDTTLMYGVGAFIGLMLVLCVGLLFASASYEAKHPCIKYGKKEMCIQPGYFIQVDKTMVWMPEQQYDCTPCVERG